MFATSASRFVGEPLGSPQKDDGHQKVNGDAGVFRSEHFAEGVGESDRQRRNHRAVDRADPADYHDHKAYDQYLITHSGKHRRYRRGNHPGKGGERRAEGEYQRK